MKYRKYRTLAIICLLAGLVASVAGFFFLAITNEYDKAAVAFILTVHMDRMADYWKARGDSPMEELK